MSTDVDVGQIERAVEAHRDALIQFTSDLIRAESITGEGPVQELIARRLHARGLEVDRWVSDLEVLAEHPAYFSVEGLDFRGRPNVVGICRGSGGGRSLILNGHVDTIPVAPVTSWARPPFSGEVADGRVHGRGASDMKGGLAAMTVAIEVLLDLGLQPKVTCSSNMWSTRS